MSESEFRILRAIGRWELYAANANHRWITLLGLSYVVLVLTCALAMMVGTVLGDLIDPPVRFPRSGPLELLARALFVVSPLLLVPFVVGLFVNVPLFVVLRRARRRVPMPVARMVAAGCLLVWIEWAWYQISWFDVWRHGLPSARFWLREVIPLGVAFACAGAVIGGVLVRETATRQPPV